jgi:hypothetical protein
MKKRMLQELYLQEIIKSVIYSYRNQTLWSLILYQNWVLGNTYSGRINENMPTAVMYRYLSDCQGVIEANNCLLQLPY